MDKLFELDMSYFIGSDARNGLGTRRLLPRGNASQGTIRNTAHVTVNVGLVIVKREFVVTVVQREHIHAWMKLGRIKVVYWACFAFKTVETKTSGLNKWVSGTIYRERSFTAPNVLVLVGAAPKHWASLSAWVDSSCFR